MSSLARVPSFGPSTNKFHGLVILLFVLLTRLDKPCTHIKVRVEYTHRNTISRAWRQGSSSLFIYSWTHARQRMGMGRLILPSTSWSGVVLSDSVPVPRRPSAELLHLGIASRPRLSRNARTNRHTYRDWTWSKHNSTSVRPGYFPYAISRTSCYNTSH